jgi:enoyl-CoA hydratase
VTDEILTRVASGVGIITLNRPKALHALNRGMCEAMIEPLCWPGERTRR